MDEYEAINIESRIADFTQQMAARASAHRQDLLETMVYSLQHEYAPRKRRPLLQTAVIAVVRRAASALNQILEDIDEEDQDAPHDPGMVDAPYIVIEPEPPIAATFTQRKADQYGTTRPTTQQRGRRSAAHAHPAAGTHRAWDTVDKIRDAGDERLSSGDGEADR